MIKEEINNVDDHGNMDEIPSLVQRMRVEIFSFRKEE
jgi:hypothetical protein